MHPNLGRRAISVAEISSSSWERSLITLLSTVTASMLLLERQYVLPCGQCFLT